MADKIATFMRQREILQAAASAPPLVLLPSPAAAEELLNEPDDGEMLDDRHPIDRDIGGHADGAQTLLDEFAATYDRDRVRAKLGELKGDVLQSVAGPFGVGKLFSALDQAGGGVDTIVNARAGVYATEEERRRHAERPKTEPAKVYSDKKYRDANKALSEQVKAGSATDTYTNTPIKPAHLHDQQLGPSIDHVIPIKRIDDDAGRTLAEQSTIELANTAENMASTTRSVNSKLKEHSAARLAQILKEEAPARQARLRDLEARKGDWIDAERKEFNKLQKQESIDIERIAAAERKAQAAVDARINKAYYTSGKFARQAARASATEGAKMGMQQALGIVVVEFFAGVIAEVEDLWRHRIKETSIVKDVGVRLRRVARRVAGKWKSALKGLGQGFLSGLLSSLVTTLINTFLTTAKRVVRMIREGGMSLLRAGKLLMFRPEGMTKSQALHETTKILVGGIALLGGIALEEGVAKYLTPVLGPIADSAAAAIAGAVTAISACFGVHLLDKADFFKVNADARDRAVGQALDKRLAAAVKALEEDNYVPPALPRQLVIASVVPTQGVADTSLA